MTLTCSPGAGWHLRLSGLLSQYPLSDHPPHSAPQKDIDYNERIERFMRNGDNMHTLTANEAKTQFGDMLLKAQREPVQINRNGKPVAVVVSIEDYEQMEAMKLQLLKAKIQRAQNDIHLGNIVDGDTFFDELMDQHKG